MDKITISDQFRTPLAFERKLKLWIDRIGSGYTHHVKKNLRILGLYAVVAVKTGDGEFYSKRTGKVFVSAGDTIITCADEPCAYGPNTEWDSFHIVWGGEEAAWLEELGFLSTQRPVVVNSADIVFDAYRALLKIIDFEDKGAMLERKNIIMNMVLKLFKHGEIKSNNRIEQIIQKCIIKMNNDFNKNIAVTEYAATANLSATHFRRCFRKHTGRTPKEFLLSIKISKAKGMLLDGYSIKETASLLGWDDEFYFMRVFKNICGISAGNFRNMYNDE